MTSSDTKAHADPAQDTAARLLAEGTQPLVDAARKAGLNPVPSLRTLLRAAISGKLESVKVAGRRVTSAPAIVRWIARQQRKRNAQPEPARTADPAVLERYGLGRGEELGP